MIGKSHFGFISFVIANPSAWTRLPEPAAQQASQGESGETAQHHGVCLALLGLVDLVTFCIEGVGNTLLL